MKIDLYLELLRAALDNDRDRVIGSATRAVAAEKSAGRHGTAQDVRRALDSASARRGRVTPKPALAGLCDELVGEPDPLVLSDAVEEHVRLFVAGVAGADALRARQIDPPMRLLLHGPPGTGKTSIARRVARQLDVPCYRLALGDVVTSYMGETGSRLSRLFKALGNDRCVLLLDELDAVAFVRTGDGSAASAEQGRVVATLATLLDDARVVIVGTTNRADLLDPAIRRRFDVEVLVGVERFQAVEAARRWLADRGWHGMNASLNLGVGPMDSPADGVRLARAWATRRVLGETQTTRGE